MAKLMRGVFTIALLVAVGCTDDDEEALTPQAFDNTLTPQQEVPVCASAAAGGVGTIHLAIADDASSILVDPLTFSGLSGPATAAHIHFGASGVAGPIVLDFGPNPTSPVVRTFTAADYPSPAPTGAPATFGAFITLMRAGDSYVNVHTAACPTGEIRAQLQ